MPTNKSRCIVSVHHMGRARAEIGVRQHKEGLNVYGPIFLARVYWLSRHWLVGLQESDC